MQTCNARALPAPRHRVERSIDRIERMEMLISSAMHFEDCRDIDPRAGNHVSVAHEMLREQLQVLRKELYGPDLGP